MPSRSDQKQLALPDRKETSLPFCQKNGSSPLKAIEHWLKEQATADLKILAPQLMTALDQLLVLNSPAKQYLQLAELLRPTVMATIEGLQKRHLSHSITFDATQQECFDLCASLKQKLTRVYRAAADTALAEKKKDAPLAQSLHRAMAQSVQSILFYTLLYRPVAKNIWQELHILFQQSSQLKLLEYAQADVYSAKNRKLSIADLYKRTLLLSRCRTNKLDSSEILQVWQALAIWSPHSKIKKTSGLTTYFAVSLKADEGLHYASPDPDKEVKGILGLDTRILAAHLKKLRDAPDKSAPLSPRLIVHLASAWAQIIKRQHPRAAGNINCELSAGFSAAHYHLSAKRDFQEITAPYLQETEAPKKTFDTEERDVWSDAHDAEKDREQEAPPSNTETVIQFSGYSEAKGGDHYPLQLCKIINSSQGGYCLEISGTPLQKINIGDPVTVKELPDDSWQLAAIRWVEIISPKRTKLGLEILTPKASPCAIALIHKTQGTTLFQRGFMLPELPAIGQLSSLIMPGLAAKPGMKFKLLHQDVISKGQLSRCSSSTRSYSEFQYHLFGQ